uniref:ATP synthase subunit delta, chloroplastic n=1 Tax=Spyridia filamentosa TaxID=196632 RepID=A0A1Z1MJG6_SPYFI|nr:ATP synthase CF1 subunit delta [Spyridia filamentosa]ARW66198.1 ATP synthase CF1 subunit delta [Spyridia filamentosa]
MSNYSMMQKVATPYAEALLGLTQEKNLIQEAKEDLSAISSILLSSNDLKLFLINPLIDSVVKKNVLEELLKDQVNNFILKFLLVLVDRRRISLLDIIISKYLELAYKLELTVLAEVLVATAFTESQKDALINKIKIMTKSQNVQLAINTDPSLIGGFIIKIGSKVIDASLLGKLKQLAFYLNMK